MRKVLAIIIGKILIFSCRTLKVGGGLTLPGLIAEYIDPKIISKLTKNIKKGSIIITGTNGKTTTAKILSEIFKKSGYKIIHNRTGSNLTRGIASALIEKSSIFGKVKADLGLFEIDEATMPEATSKIKTKVILVNNLFRDQLDRYGELDKTAEIIGNSFKNAKDATIILNSDDPLVASLKKYAKTQKLQYFGIEEEKYQDKSESAIDSKNCLLCGHELKFKIRFFGHMGKYTCPKCGFNQPKSQFKAKKIKLKGMDSSEMEIVIPDGIIFLSSKLPGLYNIYNILGAIAVARQFEVKLEDIEKALDNFSAAFGRVEKVEVKGREVYILLVKNPTGFNQVIQTLNTDPNPKNLLIALNDNFADGTDVSWIWDSDLEYLAKNNNFTIASGIRAHDMALRLKYADFDLKKVTITPNLKEAFDKALEETKDKLYILPTYTCMTELRNYLTSRGYAKGFWKE